MYSRENYAKVKEILEARRQNAASSADERNREVAQRSPDIRTIDAELRTTGLLLFKTACNGGDITPIRERNVLLTNQRKEALLKLGLPEDYTDIKYTCKKCSDSGYVDGKICSCFREMLIKENIKSSGMGRLIEKQNFENFDLERYRYDEDVYKRMKSNFIEAKRFAEGLGKDYTGPTTLLFMGKTGKGKTHISTSIAKVVIERGFDVLYDSAQNIVSAFETDKFKSGYGPYEPIADKYLECDLLILDDLGTEFSTPFTISCLYNLINTRQNRGLATIISTNYSWDALKSKYEDRIYSRIVGTDAQIYYFVGKDQRLPD